MKTSSSSFFRRCALALGCVLSLLASAQPPPADTEKASPAQPPSPEAAAAPAAPAAEAEKPGEEKPLRRVDTPDEEQPRNRGNRRNSVHSGGPPLGDHTVAEGNRVHEAVSISGSTTVDGEVMRDAVSVMGSTIVSSTGKVGGAAVAVLGRLEVKGEVRQKAVAVLGTSFIDGHVGQEVVCVLGDVQLGPNAVVDGDIVSVGGTVTRDPKAVVNGNEVRMPFVFAKHLDGLMAYARNCVMLARPLAFGPHLAWAWVIALCFFALYLVLALLFSEPLTKCVQTLETRPGASVLAAVLTVLLTPVAIVLLCFTVVGIVLVPFVVIGLFFAALFGKATMLAWIGRRFTKFFGAGIFSHIFFAVLIGGVLVLLLYTVPVLGFLLLKLLGWLGLGVVIFTILNGMKRSKPVLAPAAAAGATASVAMPGPIPEPTTVSAMAPPPSTVSEPSPQPAAGPAPGEPIPPAIGAMPMPPPTSIPPPPPTPPPAFVPSTLPRAGFMIRFGALLLDVLLVGLLAAFLNDLVPRSLRFNHSPGSFLILLAVYGAVMWKLKGTTIGGIVCGLKVVRVDNRPIDWSTAVVRALGCFLSLVAVGLGFLWVAIDDEKQSWHDKIAGTTVVYVPKGVSLL